MNVGIFSTLGAKIDHFYVTLTTRAGVRNEGKRFTWPYKATESHFSELINYAYSNTMPRAGEGGWVAQTTLSRLHTVQTTWLSLLMGGGEGKEWGKNTRRLDCMSSVKPLKLTSIQERSVHSLAWRNTSPPKRKENWSWIHGKFSLG